MRTPEPTNSNENQALDPSKLIRGLTRALIAELSAKFDLTDPEEVRDLKGYVPFLRGSIPHLAPLDQKKVRKLIDLVLLD